MAAPMKMSLSATRQLSHCLRKAILQEKTATPVLSQIRCKNMNKSGNRGRAPPEPKHTEKWTPRLTKIKAQTKKMSSQELDEFNKRVPVDDVWLHSYYPTQKVSLREAIIKHREYAVPEMLDNQDGLVMMWTEIDMLKKKNSTKYISEIKKTFLVPHNFNDGKLRNIVAFCKNSEEKAEAYSLGAAYAGGIEVVKDIQKGEISQEEFDFVVCTTEMFKDIAPIRKLIKTEIYPSKKAGSLGNDLKPMLDLYLNGKTYRTSKVADGKAVIQCPIGRLNMPLEHLEENFRAYVSSICEHQPKPLKEAGVPFMTSAVISCPPSSEKFLIKDEYLVPMETDEEEAGSHILEESPEEEVVVAGNV